MQSRCDGQHFQSDIPQLQHVSYCLRAYIRMHVCVDEMRMCKLTKKNICMYIYIRVYIHNSHSYIVESYMYIVIYTITYIYTYYMYVIIYVFFFHAVLLSYRCYPHLHSYVHELITPFRNLLTGRPGCGSPTVP